MRELTWLEKARLIHSFSMRVIPLVAWSAWARQCQDRRQRIYNPEAWFDFHPRPEDWIPELLKWRN